MSRYSPTVHPESGGAGAAGAAIADALQGVAQHLRQKKQDKIAEEERQRQNKREDEQDTRAREAAERQKVLDAIAMFAAGYREGEPPPGAPVDAPGGNPDVAMLIDAQRGNRTQGMAAPAAAAPAGIESTYVDGHSRLGNRLPSGPGVLTDPAADPFAAPPGPGPGMGPAPLGPRPGALIAQAATQFYRLPGGMGYIDESATPEARRRQREDEVDEREERQLGERDARDHTQALELADRTDERQRARDDRLAGREDARDDRRYHREVDLEGLRSRNARSLQDLRGQQARDVATIRNRGTAGADQGPLDPKTLDARGRLVGQQIDDAERRLDDEGERLETDEFFASEGSAPDSTAYHAVAAEIDSLRGVQRQISSARSGDAGARHSIDLQTRGSAYKQELSQLEQKRQRALAKGHPREVVDRAYADDTAALARKHGF
jgi:hypothetical protein